jgi:phosphatidylglycerol:prolipoprotein diacylglycerol transferase
VALGIVAGLVTLRRLSPRRDANDAGAVWIVAAALVGGALGAKLLELAVLPWSSVAAAGWTAALLSGRTVIGGFVGGSVAVVLVKRWLGIRERRGNEIAPAIAIGLAIGRIGCLCAGCCYGTPTSLPWGVDFGDGVARHPTQLYEALFALAAFGLLLVARRRSPAPGRLFTAFVTAYLLFRFAEEFVREGDRIALGITPYQVAAAAGLAWFAAKRRLLPAAPEEATPRSPAPSGPPPAGRP